MLVNIYSGCESAQVLRHPQEFSVVSFGYVSLKCLVTYPQHVIGEKNYCCTAKLYFLPGFKKHTLTM